MIKLGEYKLRNVETFMGHDGYGLNAKLYKGKDWIASAHDGGYGGGMEINLNTAVTGDSESEYCKQVIADMTRLLNLIGNVKEADSLAKRFDYNMYSACEGFIELLMVLKNYQSLANKMYKKCGDDYYYIVYEQGYSWFVNGDGSGGLSAFGVKAESLEDAKKLVFDKFKKDGDTPCGYIILKGKFEFNINFETYANMYKELI